jgi:hypothetical protein
VARASACEKARGLAKRAESAYPSEKITTTLTTFLKAYVAHDHLNSTKKFHFWLMVGNRGKMVTFGSFLSISNGIFR